MYLCTIKACVQTVCVHFFSNCLRFTLNFIFTHSFPPTPTHTHIIHTHSLDHKHALTHTLSLSLMHTHTHTHCTGCKECSNEPCFDSDDHVPIHPLPPVANIRKCQLKNHHKCFQKSLESNPKFAHSIEQLVVWLIESEKGTTVRVYRLCVCRLCVCRLCVCVCVCFRGEGVYRACTHRVVVVYHAYPCDPWICCAELGSEVCAQKTMVRIRTLRITYNWCPIWVEGLCVVVWRGNGGGRVALGSFSSFFIALSQQTIFCLFLFQIVRSRTLFVESCRCSGLIRDLTPPLTTSLQVQIYILYM